MASRNRGRGRVSLRDLSRITPTDDELSARHASISSGEPTTAAIAEAVLVEHELESLLRGHFPKNDDATWLALNNDNGPLRSFYAKILLAHAFSIIDNASLHNINVIRNIRNAFAHSKAPLSFDSPLLVKELRSVELPSKPNKGLITAIEFIQQTDKHQTAYAVLCDRMAAALVARGTKRLKRKHKRLKEQITRLEQPAPRPLGLLESLLQPHSDHQTDDPKSAALLSSPSKPQAKPKAKALPRSKGSEK